MSKRKKAPNTNYHEGEIKEFETLFEDIKPAKYNPPKGVVLPVLIQSGPRTYGSSFVFRKNKVYVGRSPDCDLILHDLKVSRRHAFVEFKNVAFPKQIPFCILHDNNSKNGTFINDMKVEEPRTLKSGDRILMGESTLWYFVRSELELEYEKNLKKILEKHCMSPVDQEEPPRVNAFLELVFPEETFTPRKMSCTLDFIAPQGMRVKTEEVNKEMYEKVLKGTRFAKISIPIRSNKRELNLHSRISWLHLDVDEEPPVCTLGVMLEKLSEEDREILMLLSRSMG